MARSQKDANTTCLDIMPITLSLVDRTYQRTDYEDKHEADQVFAQLRAQLQATSESKDGQKLIQKFFFLAQTVSTEGTFHNMVKIVWRMVKDMSGTPLHRLSLFFISLGTLCATLNKAEGWRDKVERWLGRQLTIGGKGCAGEGEGSVISRIQRFFSTPYLHDFD